MTVEKECIKLRRVLDFLRRYQKGLSTTDRRLARAALTKQILFLERQRGIRISRGPRDARKAPGCGGRVISIEGADEKAAAGLQ